jgi:hypothetical protein
MALPHHTDICRLGETGTSREIIDLLDKAHA